MRKNFWDGLGMAAIVLAICLGFGGCVYLCEKASQHPTTEVKP